MYTSNETKPLQQQPTGPLAGIRVVDMTSVAMGPYATQILGDMGAEVIKVESPAGDVFRHAEPARHAGMGACFLNLNRNKQFLVLDVKREEDLARLKGLIAEADVFISNVRPQSLRRLGLDYDSLRMANPRLDLLRRLRLFRGGSVCWHACFRRHHPGKKRDGAIPR